MIIPFKPYNENIIAVTIGTFEDPKLVCVSHVVSGLSVDLSYMILGQFEMDDLEPGEACDVYGCGLPLGPSLETLHDGLFLQ